MIIQSGKLKSKFHVILQWSFNRKIVDTIHTWTWVHCFRFAGYPGFGPLRPCLLPVGPPPRTRESKWMRLLLKGGWVGLNDPYEQNRGHVWRVLRLYTHLLRMRQTSGEYRITIGIGKKLKFHLYFQYRCNLRVFLHRPTHSTFEVSNAYTNKGRG